MKKNNYLTYILVGFFCVSLLFFLFSITYYSIEKISIKRFKSELNDLKNREARFLKLEKSLKEWKKINDTYYKFEKKYLMKFSKFSDFKNELKAFFRSNDLNSFRFEYKIKSLFKGKVEISMDFDLIGSYGNLKKFICKIAKREKMVFFKNIQLKKTKSGIIGKFSMEGYFVR